MKRNKWQLLLGVLVLITSCSSPKIEKISIRTDKTHIHYTVEIADNPISRGRGLMHRKDLAAHTGMLFIYPNSARRTLWMKNVSIPLDIIFIDKCGVIVKMQRNATPYDETAITSELPVKAVLEVKNLPSSNPIQIGDQVVAPYFSKQPCS